MSIFQVISSFHKITDFPFSFLHFYFVMLSLSIPGKNLASTYHYNNFQAGLHQVCKARIFNLKMYYCFCRIRVLRFILFVVCTLGLQIEGVVLNNFWSMTQVFWHFFVVEKAIFVKSCKIFRIFKLFLKKNYKRKLA